MNTEERLKQASEAKAILENPRWISAWAQYRQQLLDEIERADPEDVETVLRYKRLLAAGTAARAILERTITDGKVADLELASEKQRKRWFDN